MRLQQIVATPHPAGNRIVLRWHNPSPDQYPGVLVVRREDTHPKDPNDPNDGIVVAAAEGLETVEDRNLQGETVYYYTLFPYGGDPIQYDTAHLKHNRTAAMATAPYNMAGQMYDLLPGIYHRYDTVIPNRAAAEVVIFLVLLLATAGLYRFLLLLLQNYPPVMALEDTKRGQLRRFLDLPGGQLDQLYSFATALMNLYDLDRVDGRLLPLLAEWIGWQTDYRLEIAKQRNEIRYAPYLYQTIGLIPTLEATVKRILGWESRTKEFVHNVFRTNCPERLNLWLRQRNNKGEWSQPTAPLSLNFAYEGRPTAVRDSKGVVWLFYHRLKQGYGSNSEGQGAKKDCWEIWYKTYRKEGEEGEWSPSQPLVSDRQIEKYPTAALQGTKLWLFWTTFLETEQRWQLNYHTCTNGNWSSVQPLLDDRSDRRQPWATSDGSGGLWLFWSERVGTQWQLKYNRHDGNTWQLATAATFPLDNGQEPRVESDLFVLFHPSDTVPRLWVFWARKQPTGTPNQTRWQIAYRVKQGLNPNVTTDWREVRTLPWAVPAEDDREPAALVNENGSIELFWSSTRNGSWSIWHTLLDTTGTAEPITTSPYSQRTPLCIPDPDGTLLIYRSNQSLSYASKTYGATDTTDFRYAGCTSVDTRNRAKSALREQFEDFQTYTYAAKPEENHTGSDWYAWYARQDTVGLFLTPTPEYRDLLSRDQELLKNVLPQFCPIQMRVEFFIPPFEEETYNAAQTVIETATDVGIGYDAEIYTGGIDAVSDRIPQWHLFYTNDPNCLSANLTVSPAESRSRTWHPLLDIDAETYNKGIEVASDRIPQWQLFYTNNSNCLSANLTVSPTESRSRTWHPVFADNELPTPHGGNL